MFTRLRVEEGSIAGDFHSCVLPNVTSICCPGAELILLLSVSTFAKELSGYGGRLPSTPVVMGGA